MKAVKLEVWRRLLLPLLYQDAWKRLRNSRYSEKNLPLH